MTTSTACPAGHPVDPGQHFCPLCGSPIAGAGAALQATGPAAPPDVTSGHKASRRRSVPLLLVVLLVSMLLLGGMLAVLLHGDDQGSAGAATGTGSEEYTASAISDALLLVTFPNAAPGEVTVTCQDAPRERGSVSDCLIDWVVGGDYNYRVTFVDDRGHFKAICECRNTFGESISHVGTVG